MNKIVTTLLLLSASLALTQQLKKVDQKLDWNAPAGFETNGVYNIRYLAEGSVTADWKTWPILAVVTNSTSHWLYNAWETQLFSVSHTNSETGVESVDSIAPIHAQAFPRTNGTPAPVDVPDVPTPRAGLSLQYSWNGPPNWQANGGVFNIRYASSNSVISNYATWPVHSTVTNLLYTTFLNVSPTQFYAVSFTNAVLGSETLEGISPVRGVYY